MPPPNPLKYEDMSPEAHAAVHAARDEAQAREMARQVQLEEAIDKASLQTKADVMEVLEKVFGNTEPKNPKEMSILVQRIPILCTQILQMHSDIGEIKDNNKWLVRAVFGMGFSILTAIAVAFILNK